MLTINPFGAVEIYLFFTILIMIKLYVSKILTTYALLKT